MIETVEKDLHNRNHVSLHDILTDLSGRTQNLTGLVLRIISYWLRDICTQYVSVLLVNDLHFLKSRFYAQFHYNYHIHSLSVCIEVGK